MVKNDFVVALWLADMGKLVGALPGLSRMTDEVEAGLVTDVPLGYVTLKTAYVVFPLTMFVSSFPELEAGLRFETVSTAGMTVMV